MMTHPQRYFVCVRNDTGRVLYNTFIHIAGPLEQIGLGGSGSVAGVASVPEYTFGRNLFLESP
jgi:hypothetical protein